MGFLSAVSAKISAMRQRSKDKKRFLESLLRAADDGKFTDDEIKELQSRYKELELTENDIKVVRAQAYNAALRAARSDGRISADEESELTKLQTFLKIPDTEIAKSKKDLARLRLLTEIQNGNPSDCVCTERGAPEERGRFLVRARKHPRRASGRKAVRGRLLRLMTTKRTPLERTSLKP